MRILILPTLWERRAALEALPAAHAEPGAGSPTWRAGDLRIVESGIGPGAMRTLLPRLESVRPQAMWLLGWCGGLSPELGSGDLVLADVTLSARENGGLVRRIAHPPPAPLLAHMRRLARESGWRMVVGSVLSVDRLVASAEEKRAAGATGAVAVEMEAWPLALWAAERSVPWIHLRVVLDPLTASLPPTPPPDGEHGRASGRALLRHMLTRPRDWPALWDLIRRARVAGRATTSVVAALARPGGPLDPHGRANW